MIQKYTYSQDAIENLLGQNFKDLYELDENCSLNFSFSLEDMSVEVSTVEPVEPTFEGLEGCAGVVFATSYEKLEIWRNYNEKVNWEEQCSGKFFTIGYIVDRPVCVTVFFNTLNGKKIAFVDATSMLVDWAMVNEWVRKHICNTGQPYDNAMNFHTVINKAGIL